MKGSERQKEKPAVQLLSNSIARAIEYCGTQGFYASEVPCKEVSEFVGLINAWFDLFSSRTKFVANKPTKNAYGSDLPKQEELLGAESTLIGTMSVENHKSLIQFQKGMLLSNRSLGELFTYLQSKYAVEYILTSRLKEDILEIFSRT